MGEMRNTTPRYFGMPTSTKESDGGGGGWGEGEAGGVEVLWGGGVVGVGGEFRGETGEK